MNRDEFFSELATIRNRLMPLSGWKGSPNPGENDGRMVAQDPNANEFERAQEARANGYSPEVAQIHARHNDGFLASRAAPRNPNIAYDRVNEGTRLGVVADSRVDMEQIARNREGQQDTLGAMRATRNLRDFAGQAMTLEEGDRRRQRLEGQSERMRMMGEDTRRFDAQDSTARFVGEIPLDVARTNQAGLDYRAAIDAQTQTGLKASELAMQGKLMEGAGFRSSPATGAEVFVGPKGDAQYPPRESLEPRPLTPVAKLNDDLSKGLITQEQYDAEVKRRQETENPIVTALRDGGVIGPRAAPKPAAAPTPKAPAPEGAVMIDPRTGQKVVKRNGNWYPAGS
jgi:hypothetical protein